MKWILSLITLFALGIISLGSAQEDPWANVDPSGQKVTFWHQHSGIREEMLQKIVTEFNATNPYGITVEAPFQGGYGEIFNQMLVRLNTPDVPDLVVAYQNQSATYQLAEGLLDMRSLVSSPTWGLSQEEIADFFPGFWQQDIFSTFGGARLAFPPNRSLEVMYYNADWLAELGYDAPPATPAAFGEIACAATKTPFSKATVTGSQGYQLSLDASRFASWTFAFGGNVFDYETNRYTLDSPAAIEAMTFLQKLIGDGCASTVTERNGDQTNFGAGALMFTVSSSSGFPFYQQAIDAGSKHNWSIAAIPHVTPEPVMNQYGASVSMPVTDSPERQLAAWIFLKYYTSPEVQGEWAVASNYFPVRASAVASLKDYFVKDPNYAKAFDLLQYATSEPPVPGYDFVRDRTAEAMAAIANGADVASTLAALNIEANEILDEQLEEMTGN